MKTKIILFFCLISIFSCKKDIIDPIQEDIDYRLKYTGEYNFFSQDWSVQGPYSTFDTMTFTGSIAIVDNTDSLIRINYRAGGQTYVCNGDSLYGVWIEAFISTNGSLKWDENNCGHLGGSFSNTDSLNLNIHCGYSPHDSRGLILQGTRRNN